jgi:peroxiredoxin
MKTFNQIILANLLSVLAVFDTAGQATGKTIQLPKQTTYLLQDGSVLAPDKLDSISKAWGEDRLAFQHGPEDDEKGIMRLVRITDEMKQKMEDQRNKSKQGFAAMLNKPAPDFELKDLQGNRWSLKELRGKTVVLNFWFTSCAPCIQEMPELNQLVRKYGSKNVVFLGLANDNAKQVNTFLQNHTFSYVLLPASQEVANKYLVSSWPTSMVIDKEGNVKMIVGSSPKIREDLEAVINALK